MRKKAIDAATSSVALVSLLIMLSMIFSALSTLSSTDEIRLIANELTTTPVRQQQALDTLAKYDEQALVCLLPYFADKRPIASSEVKFLNKSPAVDEKYFLTEGETVGGVLIQYFCWRTMRCVVDSTTDIEKLRRRIEADIKSQIENDRSKNPPCLDRLGDVNGCKHGSANPPGPLAGIARAGESNVAGSQQ